MKKILILMAFCLSSICLSAQVNDEIAESNSKCRFDFDNGYFVGCQAATDYVVYEIPEMSAGELKSAAYTVLSSMYKSPKDVITSLSENMIQLEGYASKVYGKWAGESYYNRDILFCLVIQFKDGKIRYNIPAIKQIYSEWPLSGMARLDMNKPLSFLVDDSESRQKVEDYFNRLIQSVNSKLKESAEW